ncbi:hypothetical protein C4K08_5607 [Pseudomonas chlororaphis subsp. aureofaciens]|nr:hypothetical protein C4K08_5607 [Pseudomonas chlororaphis subsp. aureofaciens]
MALLTIAPVTASPSRSSSVTGADSQSSTPRSCADLARRATSATPLTSCRARR